MKPFPLNSKPPLDRNLPYSVRAAKGERPRPESSARAPAQTARINPSRTHERGTTLLEVTVMLMAITPILLMLGSSVMTFTSAAEYSNRHSDILGESQNILRAIVSELMMGSTQITHPVDRTAYTAPHPAMSGATGYDENPLYCEDETGYQPLMSDLHATYGRDSVEHWYSGWNRRRFYIYGTYMPFDTLEYQRIKTPTGSIDALGLSTGNVRPSWSDPRKILLEDGKVVIKTPNPSSTEPQEVILGRGVDELSFHLNAENHIVVQLVMASPGKAEESIDIVRVFQVTIKPRSRLN